MFIALCNLVDFPKHIDTICMLLLIVYFKRSPVEFSKIRRISVPASGFH